MAVKKPEAVQAVQAEESADVIALRKQNEAMQEQMQKMQEMMATLMSQQNVSTAQFGSKEEAKELSMNAYIKVMSLYKGGMTLFTSPQNGKSYRFTEFGEIIPIMYSDLTGIISTQRRFAKEGYFVILNEEVIKQSALTRDYARIIDKEAIETILEKDVDELKDIYQNVTRHIQGLIIEHIADRLNSGEYVNRDKLHALKEISGRDIEMVAKALKDGLSDM